jgi:predicted nucleic acid-binding protein
MSGVEKAPMISWDSCVFLAWFNNEEDKPLGEIQRTLQGLADKKAKLLVSAVCAAEVLNETGQSTAGTQFAGFVKRENVIVANVDMRVAVLAAELRQHAIEAVKCGEIEKSIKAPDALIVATAMIYKAAELQTFDPFLLALNGKPFVKGLPVIPPDDSGKTPLGF